MSQSFSLIIPAHNSEKYISACLQSVLKQKLNKKKYEIIIINDASSDKTLTICRKHKKISKNIKIYNNKKNLGVSLSRNIGIKKAKGKYLVFLDSDDQLKKDSLNKIETALKGSTIDLLISLGMEKNIKNLELEKLKYKRNYYESFSKSEIFKFMNSYLNFRAYSWNFIVNKNFLHKNNIYFDRIKVFEDQVFTTKALFLAKNVRFYKKSFHHHFERFNSLGRSMKFVTLMSILNVLKNMNKLYSRKYLDKEQKKFLDSRIKFIFKLFKINFLLTNKNETRKVFIFLKKNMSKSFIDLEIINKNRLLLFKKKNIQNIINFNYKKFSKIFIFGAGMIGRVICYILKKNKIPIEAFFDSNIYFRNQKYLGIKIVNLNDSIKPYFKKPENPLVIVSHLNRNVFSKINKKLKKYGLKKYNIRAMNCVEAFQ